MPQTVAERIADGNEFVSEHIYALEAQHINELYRAYLQAYQELQQQAAAIFGRMAGGETWSVADVAARNALLQQIAQRMLELDSLAAQQVLNYGLAGYKAGYYGAGYVLDTSVLEAMGLNRATIPFLPEIAIRAQLLAPYEGVTFLERFNDNRTEFQSKIKRSLVQSQVQGETVYQAQKRIAEALGIDISRRTKADRASNQALFARTENIARTELLRASNNGSHAVYEANRDVLRGYEIKTAMDERVCPICGPLDGKQYAFGQGQRPPFHPRCRCTVLPVLIDSGLQREITGERKTFTEWATERGLTQSVYGQAYELRRKSAPQKPSQN